MRISFGGNCGTTRVLTLVASMIEADFCDTNLDTAGSSHTWDTCMNHWHCCHATHSSMHKTSNSQHTHHTHCGQWRKLSCITTMCEEAVMHHINVALSQQTIDQSQKGCVLIKGSLPRVPRKTSVATARRRGTGAAAR